MYEKLFNAITIYGMNFSNGKGKSRFGFLKRITKSAFSMLFSILPRKYYKPRIFSVGAGYWTMDFPVSQTDPYWDCGYLSKPSK